MRRFGLIGTSLKHSFSKNYFTAKFAAEGRTDCSYENYELQDTSELPSLVQNTPGLEGLNVTIPFKQEVIALLHWKDQVVEQIGACNCIRINEGKLLGYNTDAPAIISCLQELLQPHHKKALVLGTGGASAAAGYALRQLGIAFQKVSRKPKEGELCYQDLGKEIMREHTVIINTTPLGMYPGVDSYPDIPYEEIGEKHLLFDLVYNPEKTLFLQKGEAQGAAISNGYRMLLLQAEASWKIWNDLSR